MTDSEVLHSSFDAEVHAKHFINYLEVIILPDGTVEYAVPSHEKKLMDVANLTPKMLSKEQLSDIWCGGTIEWLCKYTGCISVWNDYYIGHANNAQRRTLLHLKSMGLYTGKLYNEKTQADINEWLVGLQSK